jgi:predicted metal-dependent enzyme (double-stranded beta helix superfamily)
LSPGREENDAMSEHFTSFCQDIRELLLSTTDQEEIFRRGQPLLAAMAGKPAFFQDVFHRMVTDEDYLMGLRLSADPNEVTLHKDKDGLFSVRLYIWDPAISYPIHGHGSWGIVTTVAGLVEETRYQRLDDHSIPGYAKLKETGRRLMAPGETGRVLPLDLGIHKMGSAVKEHSSVGLHVYGKAIRPGFLEKFELDKESVYRVTYPGMNSRVYVLKALGAIEEPWAAEVLEQAVKDKRPLIRYEAVRALGVHQKEKALQIAEAEYNRESVMKSDFKALHDFLK